MKRIGIYFGWAFLISLTLFIAIVHSGCGGSQSSAPATKPEPKMTDQVPLTCFRVERGAMAEAFFCSSEQLCKAAHSRMVAFWGPLSEKYGATGLSDCLAVDVQFTQR